MADNHSPSETLTSSIAGDRPAERWNSSPNSVLLTGNDRFRLLTVYKLPPETDRNIQFDEETSYNPYVRINSDADFRYFMPGMDIVGGYNLVNVAHYDTERDTLTYFFAKPVLIKTLYFPGVERDSLHRKPVVRHYYMVSVYDADTNNDSLINRRDLRRMYHFDERNTCRTPLLPPRYSAIKSSYDYRLDAMYIYARFDANSNGTPETHEPVSVFMLPLDDPLRIRKII